MKYQQEIFLPFYWGDPAGVLFFGHAFAIAHQAFEGFVTSELKISWIDWFQNQEWVVPIRQTEADFTHPLFPGKNCLVKMDIVEVRTSSFFIEYHLIQEGFLCCTLKTLHIFCNKSTGQKQPIPAPIRKLFNS